MESANFGKRAQHLVYPILIVRSLKKLWFLATMLYLDFQTFWILLQNSSRSQIVHCTSLGFGTKLTSVHFCCYFNYFFSHTEIKLLQSLIIFKNTERCRKKIKIPQIWPLFLNVISFGCISWILFYTYILALRIGISHMSRSDVRTLTLSSSVYPMWWFGELCWDYPPVKPGSRLLAHVPSISVSSWFFTPLFSLVSLPTTWASCALSSTCHVCYSLSPGTCHAQPHHL